MSTSLKLTSRRFVVDCLSWELARCRRYRRVTSVLLVGVDVASDASPTTLSSCLIQTRKLLISSIRAADIAGEKGNGGLLVLLPETPKGGALVAAERVRRAVEEMALPTDDGSTVATVSIGVAGYPEDGDAVALILAAAEGALAHARALGGNQVQQAHSSTPTVAVEPALVGSDGRVG